MNRNQKIAKAIKAARKYRQELAKANVPRKFAEDFLEVSNKILVPIGFFLKDVSVDGDEFCKFELKVINE